MAEEKFQLITRADFDGIVCGALLKERDLIAKIAFAEPADMQSGRVAVSDCVITANLPFVDGVHICFNHQVSEVARIGNRDNLIIDPDAPSTARVIYAHYGGAEGFPAISGELMDAVDKSDSAQFSEEDILAPSDWTLLSFLIDPATGLNDKEFSIDNGQFFIDLMTYCRHNPIDEIMHLPDVLERVEAYAQDSEFAERQYNRCSRHDGAVVITDLRDETEIVPVNRFLVYALYPDCKVSVRVETAASGQVRIAAGKSVLNRTAAVNIGKEILKFGGGGHSASGACRVNPDQVDHTVSALVESINAAEL